MMPTSWNGSEAVRWSTPTRPAGGRTDTTARSVKDRLDLQHPHPTLLPARYFLRRGRGKTVVDEVLGDEFAGVLVSDFYAAYHHYDGPKQRCWAHLLRDIHDRRVLYPDDLPLVQWADAVHQLYQQAKAFTHLSEQRSEQQRRAAQLAPERRLLALCRPYGMTRRRRRPDCADASVTTSRNSSSSWLIRRRRRTTTPPSAACAIWSSVARSAAAPARSGAPRPRWRWPQSAAPGAHKTSTHSPPADNSLFPLKSELLPGPSAVAELLHLMDPGHR